MARPFYQSVTSIIEGRKPKGKVRSKFSNLDTQRAQVAALERQGYVFKVETGRYAVHHNGRLVGSFQVEHMSKPGNNDFLEMWRRALNCALADRKTY